MDPTSRLFLDSRLSNRWSIETFAGTKLFCWCPASYGWHWIRFDQNKKKNSKKKYIKTFHYFSRLYLYFPDFFQVWKIAGQIWRHFQEFKTRYKPCQLLWCPSNSLSRKGISLCNCLVCSLFWNQRVMIMHTTTPSQK